MLLRKWISIVAYHVVALLLLLLVVVVVVVRRGDAPNEDVGDRVVTVPCIDDVTTYGLAVNQNGAAQILGQLTNRRA